MKNICVVLCFVSAVLRSGSALPSSTADHTHSKLSERFGARKNEDLEGAETIGKLFDLKGLFPSQGTTYYPSRYPSTGSGYYPSTGGSYYPSYHGCYYPSSNGYNPSSSNYPTTGYYPGSGTSGFYPSTGTNILGHGSSSYPSQSFYPSSNPWFRTTSGSDYGITGTSSSLGGYGGYGGNGGLNSYNGYNNPRYDGKRNLGYGYHSDTDRYGFYKSPSQQLSVFRGYN